VRHGKGVIEFEDGSVYHGYWDQGTPVRAAVLRTADGRQVSRCVTFRLSESGLMENWFKNFHRKLEDLNNGFPYITMIF